MRSPLDQAAEFIANLSPQARGKPIIKIYFAFLKITLDTLNTSPVLCEPVGKLNNSKGAIR